MKKGIGMPYVFPEDMAKVNASWFYNWGALSPMPDGFVPMSWSGSDPNLPLDYDGYVLLFNEPDRPEQANLSPKDGLAIYKIFCWKYPRAKWVVGNVWYATWLYKFKELCIAESYVLPAVWGLHLYVGDLEHAKKMLEYLEDAHNKLEGNIWITEFASVFGDMSVDDILVKFFEAHDWIKRYAIFCNRAKGDEWWYPKGWDVRLFDFETGEPTKIGKWYKDGLLHSIYLPIVMNG